MKPYTRNMRQSATLFIRTGLNEYGEPSFSSENIRCRWQAKADRFLGADGEEFISQAVIYPDREIPLGARLAPGADASESAAREVRYSGASPSLDGKRALYKVAL